MAMCHVAIHREMRKMEKVRKHFDNCHAAGLQLEALVVETYGGWDPGAFNLKR